MTNFLIKKKNTNLQARKYNNYQKEVVVWFFIFICSKRKEIVTELLKIELRIVVPRRMLPHKFKNLV